MARKLKDFNFARDNDKSHLPWDFWLNGEIWEIPLSDTNYSSLNGLAAAAWQNAKRRNLKVRSQRDNNKQTLVIQAYDPDE